MDRVPVADERDGQQRRRDDEQSSGFERVHVMAMMLGVRPVLGMGGHGHIVAPEQVRGESGRHQFENSAT